MAGKTRGKVTIFPSPTLVPEIWANRSGSGMNELNKGRHTDTWDIPPLPPIPGERTPGPRLPARQASYSSQRSARSKNTTTALLTAIDTNLASNMDRTASEVTELEYGNVTIVAPWEYQTENHVLDPLAVSWTVDPLNPKNWPLWKKCVPVSAALFASFLVGMASTSLAPIAPILRTQFMTGTSGAALPTAMFLLPLTLGPSISSLISTVYGRKLPYMLSLSLLFVLVLAGSFVETNTALVACRFFTGFAAGPALSIGYDTITDFWNAANSLMPLGLHHGCLIFGAAAGAATSGPATLMHAQSWKWTQYALLIVCGIGIALAASTKDTSAVHILKRDRHWNMGTSLTKDVLLQCTSQPLGTLLASPAPLSITLYSGMALATCISLFMAWPTIYSTTYARDVHLTIILTAFVLGSLMSIIVSTVYISVFHRRWVRRWTDARAAQAEQDLTTRHEKHRSRFTPLCSPSQSHFEHMSTRPVSALSPLQQDFYQQPSVHRRSAVSLALGNLEQERNIHLAVAATRYLNSIPQNNFIGSNGTSKRIMPERVLRLLNSDPTFGDFCATLESAPYEQRFDRVQMAQSLVECLETCPKTPMSFHDSPLPTPTSGRPSLVTRPPLALSRSKSIHQNAAAGALTQFSSPSLCHPPLVLRSPSPPPEALPIIQRVLPAFPYEAPEDYRSPPEWALYSALPATVMLPTSVLIFAWTCRLDSKAHWFIPILAIFLFGVATTLIFISAGWFIMLHAVATRIPGCTVGEVSDEQEDIKHAKTMMYGALMLRWLLCFLFVMIVGRLFDAVGPAWASIVFGIIMLVLGPVPWVMIWRGRKWRDRREDMGHLRLLG